MSEDLRLALERLRSAVSSRLGLALDDGRLGDLHAALGDRVDRSAASLMGYLDRLEGREGPHELRVIAERATINETYFFRNAVQLAAFTEEMLPARAPSAAARGELRLLSAGCASGEEAYTLAMIAQERLPALAPGCRLSVIGIDVSGPSLERGRRARYTDWSLRQVAPHVRAGYFRQVGREHEVVPAVRAAVELEERNLVDDDASFWRAERFDVIFFRNVAMYLSPSAFREVVRRCARSLAPGGFLVLGDAETLRGVSSEFDLRHTHQAFYYQRRERAPRVVRAGEADAPVVVPPAVEVSWVDAIHEASGRLERLAARAEAIPAGGGRRSWDLVAVTDLLREERFVAAHEALDGLPPEAGADADVQLLRAVVLTNRGMVTDAEATCERLLAMDGLSAGAHYLKALCREHRGDRSAAAELDRTAAYLDPTFAMPHLHLGLLAKRRGSNDDALAAFGQALELLAREDAARLLLFGGGFSREALLALCRAELRRLGGAP